MSVKHLYLIATAATLACAPAGGTSGTPGTPAVPRNANQLTAGELAAANADVGNLHEALGRLRPNWLAAHGATSFQTPGTEFAIVFIDGQKYGELASLRNIPASDVAEIRYYNVTEAGAKFGMRGGTGGVIEVRFKQ
jgi:hypothetical protein